MKHSAFVLTALFLSFCSLASASPGIYKQATLPIYNSAGYPFICFGVSIYNSQSFESYHGKIVNIFYGYTPATKAEYNANNDVPWFNERGEAVAQGIIHPLHKHDGGYKGSYQMDPVTVTVPKDMNVVYKLGITKLVQGSCYGGGNLRFEYAETKTYFFETK